MIPQGAGQFSPWLTGMKVGDKVTILTEPAPKDNPKLKSPFYCEVQNGGKVYSIGFNWTTYYEVSKHESYGLDTKDWVGKQMVYGGMRKTKKGAMAHVWLPTDQEIDLEKAPF